MLGISVFLAHSLLLYDVCLRQAGTKAVSENYSPQIPTKTNNFCSCFKSPKQWHNLINSTL